MANKKVRILVAGSIDGVAYQPNDVVSLPANLAEAHVDTVDSHKDAVAYALTVNGNRVIEHVSLAEVAQPDSPQE